MKTDETEDCLIPRGLFIGMVIFILILISIGYGGGLITVFTEVMKLFK